MMVAIYGQTDKLMLKQMLDETYVGYYSTASTLMRDVGLCFTAIIDSINPTIMRLHNTNYQQYERKNRQLYAHSFLRFRVCISAIYDIR